MGCESHQGEGADDMQASACILVNTKRQAGCPFPSTLTSTNTPNTCLLVGEALQSGGQGLEHRQIEFKVPLHCLRAVGM